MKALSQFTSRAVEAVQFSESPIESLMFWALMDNDKYILCKLGDTPEGAGYFLHPQTEIGPYRVDFLVHVRGYTSNPKVYGLWKETKIIIECDGRDYHTTDEQVSADQERDKYLRDRGYNIIRFKGSMITRNPAYCAEQITLEIWEALLK